MKRQRVREVDENRASNLFFEICHDISAATGDAFAAVPEASAIRPVT
jgi:hypothetical protein